MQYCRRTIDACLAAVDAEEELLGAIPDANRVATVRHPELALRAAVRATKKSIRRRIEAIVPAGK